MFSGQEAATVIGYFGLAGRARVLGAVFSRWRGDSGRGERLTRSTTAVVTLNDTLSRYIARILHFQLAIGALSSIAAESREISRPRVVYGDRFRICAFHREPPINGVRNARLSLRLASSRVLVASYGWILTGLSFV